MIKTPYLTVLFLTLMAFSTKAQTPNFEMIGYAAVADEENRITTGGEGGDSVFVSTLPELLSFAKHREKNHTPEILILNGYFEASPSIVVTFKHGSNLSILGSNDGAELNGVGIRLWDYNNSIVRNLKIHEIFYPDDALSIEECLHVWIDHNELHSKIGPGIGVDTYDGLLDIKKGSRYVTVSWNYLHDHMKCMLIGHTDNATQGEEDVAMRITIHHNIFENTNGRNPSLRWGAAHLFNNLYNNIDDYAIALRQGAHGLIENNHFNNVNTCISTTKFKGIGNACVSGNIYTGSANENNNVITQTDCEFWDDLPYTYELDSTDSIESHLREFAGVGVIDITEIINDIDTTDIENGINDFSLNQLKYYPNPAQNKLNLNFNSPEAGEISVKLLTTSGQIVLEKKEAVSKGKNTMEIATTSIPSGLYLLIINDTEINRLVKTILVTK